jgi:hypothetical protein
MADRQVSPEALMARMPWDHPGPKGGQGRGPGRPWGGIVEDTPALWVGWIVALARGHGAAPPGLQLQANGRRLCFECVRLTYGLRWYFLCPECGRRCEALFFGHRVACRKCLRLGYRSQAHTSSSPELLWADVLTRQGHMPRRCRGAGILREQFEALLRAKAEAGIRRILDAITQER